MSTFAYTAEKTLYAKPMGSTELGWGDDVIAASETQFGGSGIGHYSFATDDSIDYVIYEQAGASPDSTDGMVGVIEQDLTGAIKAKTDTLGSGTATVSQPVATDGTLTEPIIIGDDYLDTHSREFSWNVDALPGVDVGDASCYFGAKNSAGTGFLVEGTVSTVDVDTWKVAFDLAASDTTGLTPGVYEWSVEVRDDSGKKVTRVRNADYNYRVQLVEKQT